MAPKHHHMPLSGGDRKALTKELSKSRAMTKIFAERSAEKRREGEALIREADNLACQSWNEKMWSDGGPIDPSPTIDQAGLFRPLFAFNESAVDRRERSHPSALFRLQPDLNQPISAFCLQRIGWSLHRNFIAERRRLISDLDLNLNSV